MENVNIEKESNSERDDHVEHETRVANSSRPRRKRRIGNYWALFTLFAFLVGLGGGYFLGDYEHTREHQSTPNPVSIAQQINPSDGYPLPATFGDLGPQLLAAGAIDYDKFVALYARSGQPLSEEQLAILNEGSDDQIVINRDNAYFLINFFWAFGLANENPILTEGAMMKNGREQVIKFLESSNQFPDKGVNLVRFTLGMASLFIKQGRRETIKCSSVKY